MVEKCRAQKSITCILLAVRSGIIFCYIFVIFCLVALFIVFFEFLFMFFSFDFSIIICKLKGFSWFVYNMICLSLGFHILGGGVNWLAELYVVLFQVLYIL